MEIKVVKFTTKEEEPYAQARKIRTIVFVNEQKVSKEEEFDGLDDDAVHYLVYFNENIAGTGRRRITKEGHKLERFAVYKNFRGKQIGANLLKAMMQDILPTEKLIYLNAQVSAQKFYAKYGFKKEGEIFVEANIEHYKMIYQKKQ